jgi:hypothetical protein
MTIPIATLAYPPAKPDEVTSRAARFAWPQRIPRCDRNGGRHDIPRDLCGAAELDLRVQSGNRVRNDARNRFPSLGDGHLLASAEHPAEHFQAGRLELRRAEQSM